MCMIHKKKWFLQLLFGNWYKFNDHKTIDWVDFFLPPILWISWIQLKNVPLFINECVSKDKHNDIHSDVNYDLSGVYHVIRCLEKNNKSDWSPCLLRSCTGPHCLEKTNNKNDWSLCLLKRCNGPITLFMPVFALINHARYLSVHATSWGSWNHSLFK